MKYLKRVFELSKENKNTLAMGLGFAFLKDLSFISIFLAIHYTFVHIDAINSEIIKNVILILLGGMFYHFVLRLLENTFVSAQGYKIFRDYRMDAGERLKKAPMGYFSEQKLGNIQGAMTSTISVLENYTMMTITDIINGFSIAVILVIYFLSIDFRLGMMAFGMIILLGIVLNALYKTANKYVPVQHEIDYAMNFAVIDMVRGMSVLKIFPDKQNTKIKSSIKGAAYDLYEKKRDVDIKCEIEFSIISKLYGFIVNSSSVILILMSIYLYFESRISLENTLTMIIASYMVFLGLLPLSDGAFLSVKIPSNQRYIDQVLSIPEIKDGEIDVMGKVLDLEFKSVRFRYNEDREIIKGVDLKIEEGQNVAIVGASGSGKTTLINLITRFWDVTQGSIELAGHDIREYPVELLLKQFSLVFQDVYLFNDSVMNNIKFANSEVSDEEVYEICKKAKCHDFIMKLKDGYHTIVGEGGANFSGGEKQRISIARALLKDAPIILLDEATSSVDPENEFEILAAISELCRGKTVISIAHRLSTVENADKIFVIEDGRVAQSGNHDELLQQGGIYADFISARVNAKGWKLNN